MPYANLDVRTGAGEVSRQMGQTGETLFQAGSALFRAQGEAELTKVMADAGDKIRRMHVGFEGNTDETTYQKQFDRTWGEIENTELKNGWAKQQFSMNLPGMKVRQQELVDAAVTKRVDKNWEFAYTNKRTQAIDTRNLGILEGLWSSGLARGKFTEDFVESERQEVLRLGHRRAFAALAANDPQRILSLSNWDKMHSFKDDSLGIDGKYLIPEDYQYIRGLAANTNTERKLRADAFEEKATNDLLAGRFSFIDEKGTQVNWRDAIVASPDLDAPKKRMLEEEYNDQVNSFAKAKKYTDSDKVEAYNAIAKEDDPQEKLKLVKKHSAGLGFEKVKPFLDDLANPDKSGDLSHVAKSLDATISTVRTMRQKIVTEDSEMGDDEKAKETARINIALARQENQILQLWRAHPEWTAKQRIDEMEAILAPVKKEAAKETVRKVGFWTRIAGGAALGVGIPGLVASKLVAGSLGDLEKPPPGAKGQLQASSESFLRTATNSKTGERMGWDGTQWVKIP